MTGQSIHVSRLPKLCRERNDLSRRSRDTKNKFSQEDQDKLNELNDTIIEALCFIVERMDKTLSQTSRRSSYR